MSNNTENEEVIRSLIENWASAVRRKDLSGILRNHSSNILMFDVPPPLQSTGIEAYKRPGIFSFPGLTTRWFLISKR